MATAAIAAIAPATVTNDQPANLTVTGTGLVAGMTVMVGDQPLGDVRVQSATTLTGTLPTGLCPGTYPATVSDARGKKAVGGTLVVRGVRAVTFTGTSAGQTARRTGQSQKLTLPLPDVQISDTTCATGDWMLAVSVGVPADANGNRGAFTPQALRLEGAGGVTSVLAPLSVHGGEATAIIHLPRADARGGIVLRAGVDGEIPVNAPAGQYTLRVTITFAG